MWSKYSRIYGTYSCHISCPATQPPWRRARLWWSRPARTAAAAPAPPGCPSAQPLGWLTGALPGYHSEITDMRNEQKFKVSGHHLDTNSLQNHTSGHQKKLWRNFYKWSKSYFHKYFICRYNLPRRLPILMMVLTLLKLRLLLPKPCYVSIHWIALAEYSQMSTHVTGLQSFFRFFASFCIGQISHQQYKG